MMEHNRDIKRKNPVAEMNESKILMSLSEHPKTFTELMKELKFSPRGLSIILKRMTMDNLIQHPEYSEAYTLTQKGKRTLKAIPILKYNLEEIMEKKHSYENGRYSVEYKGIGYDLIYDSDFNFELAKIFKDKLMIFLNDLEKEIGNIPNIIKDKEQLKGKMIIAFTLDLKEMKEQFLKRYENNIKKPDVKWENEEAWSLLLKGNNKGDDIQ